VREISLVVNIAGTLILLGIPIKLSLPDTIKGDWENTFSQGWRTWLVIGVLLISFGVSLSVLD
jgi:hypothetical protein